jgi:hypothetical protein
MIAILVDVVMTRSLKNGCDVVCDQKCQIDGEYRNMCLMRVRHLMAGTVCPARKVLRCGEALEMKGRTSFNAPGLLHSCRAPGNWQDYGGTSSGNKDCVRVQRSSISHAYQVQK